MAGTQAGFDADEFRSNIRFAMTMGAPVNEADRVTFHWNTQRTFTQADPAGVPYDLSAPAVTATPHASVQVPVALQYGTPGEEATELGGFDTAKATLTILDEDYEQVKTADYTTIGGDKYDIESVVPQGVFDVTVYTMHLHARSKA